MRNFLVISLLATVSTGQPASGQNVGLYAEVQGQSSIVELGAPGVISLHVVITQEVSSAVWFRAPIPDSWESAVYLDETCNFPEHVGDSQTGIMILFEECLIPPIHVMTINFWDDGSMPNICSVYELLPHRGSATGHVEYVDCNSVIQPTDGVPITIRGEDALARLENFSPPDGAIDQPRGTQLSWDSWSCSYYARVHDVYFGTTSDPPIRIHDYTGTTWDPGPLQPNTTYYWRVVLRHRGPGGSVGSSLWSFTTWDASPVNHSTWGAIKALYIY